MTGVPCVELDWETFEKNILPLYHTIFENKTMVWVIKDGFLIITNKPENKCGSYKFFNGSIPVLGFGNYYIR
jgi:hypothetical protein